MRPVRPEMWTQQQRTTLCIFIVVLTIIAGYRLIRDNQTVPAQLPAEGPRANEVMSQLDLNTADAASLSAIPGLGAVKAKAIVAYRDQFVSAHPGQRAFEHMESLYRIKGIGPSTVELLRQYTYITATSPTKPSG